MFADACERMMKCTFPIVSSTHFVKGDLESAIGVFVVLNPEGWALSAAHILIPFIKHKECMKKIKEVEEWNITHPDQPKEMDGSWSDQHSFWLGIPGVYVESAYINSELDLAVFKLSNFKSEIVKEYPTFKDPDKLRIGTSICKLGYSFINTPIDFNKEKHEFFIRPGALPLTIFPIDGIYTRTVVCGKCKEEEFEKILLETTAPGLHGQSGGPIFDRAGNLVGIQSGTAHMKLGYMVRGKSGEHIPEQYMHLGLGVHIKTIIQVLDKKGVKYKSEATDDGYRIIG